VPQRAQKHPHGRFGFWIILFLCASSGLFAAEKSASITVQGVKASRKGDPDNPTIPDSLKKYARILKRLGYGTYTDIGKDNKSAAVRKSAKLNVDAYTITVTVLKIDPKKGTIIKYAIKKGKEAVGSSKATLKPGVVVPVVAGKMKSPVIMLFRLGP
jgi:hypothetical protein